MSASIIFYWFLTSCVSNTFSIVSGDNVVDQGLELPSSRDLATEKNWGNESTSFDEGIERIISTAEDRIQIGSIFDTVGSDFENDGSEEEDEDYQEGDADEKSSTIFQATKESTNTINAVRNIENASTLKGATALGAATEISESSEGGNIFINNSKTEIFESSIQSSGNFKQSNQSTTVELVDYNEKENLSTINEEINTDATVAREIDELADEYEDEDDFTKRVNNVTQQKLTTTENYEYDEEVENIPLDKLIGGESCRIEDHTYFVSIQRRNSRNMWDHICGGTVVDVNWVLTAGQCCFHAQTHELRVVGGVSQIFENPKRPHMVSEGKINSLVEKIIMHPYYHEKEHDVCLLRMRTPFDNSYIQIVSLRLPSLESGLSDCATGLTMGFGIQFKPEPYVKPTNVTTVGINTTESPLNTTLLTTTEAIINITQLPQRKKFIADLQCASLSQLNYKKCEQMSMESFKKSRNLCVGDPFDAKGPCLGDTGAPLICKNKQIGIFSHAKGCGDIDMVYSFTRIDAYYRFIADSLGRTLGVEQRSWGCIARPIVLLSYVPCIAIMVFN